MSDTILDLQQPDDKSPIYNLKIYNKVTPLLLISLGSLYVSIVIFWYVRWRYRSRKQKKVRMDRQKLERYWRKRAAYLDEKPKAVIQIPVQSHAASSSYHSDEKRLPRSFDSTATLVVSGGGSFSNSSSQNQFVIPFVQHPPQEEVVVQDDEEEIVGTFPYHLRHHNTVIQKQQQSNSHNKKRRKSKRDEFMGMVTNRIDGDYQRKKRRQLQWQWSVAMGYCRYNHGHHLDTMITRLLESKSRSSKDNNTNNGDNESC